MRRTGPVAWLAFVVILGGCVAPAVPEPPGMFCTQIGCESQVLFEIGNDTIVSGATYEVEACIDGRCESATVVVPRAQGAAMGAGMSGSLMLDPQRGLVAFTLNTGDYSGLHEVSLTLVGPDGQRTEIVSDIEFERGQPTGRVASRSAGRRPFGSDRWSGVEQARLGSGHGCGSLKPKVPPPGLGQLAAA